MENEFGQTNTGIAYSGDGAATDQGVRSQAQQKLDAWRERAGEQITQRVDAQKTRTADTLTTVAQTLHQTGQLLRDQHEDGMSRYVDRAADEVTRLAGYLQNTDIDQFVDGVEDLARRRPGVFIGGAFALGFLASRFLKSSRRDIEGTRFHSYEGGYDTTTGSASLDTQRGTAVQPARDVSAGYRATGEIEIGETETGSGMTAGGDRVTWEAPRG